MLNTSPEAVLRRRQIAYDNLKKQMDEHQAYLTKLRTMTDLDTNDLSVCIIHENKKIVRIAKDLCILEDRGCR